MWNKINLKLKTCFLIEKVQRNIDMIVFGKLIAINFSFTFVYTIPIWQFLSLIFFKTRFKDLNLFQQQQQNCE